MAEELPYALLDRLLGNRHKAETPCPLCSHQRKAHNRKAPCFGMVRMAADVIHFNCMHCGANGTRSEGWREEGVQHSATRAQQTRHKPQQDATRPDDDNSAHARQLWESAHDPRGTDTERYWLHRGLILPIPPTIRHLPGMMIAIAGLPILAGGSWSDADWYPPEACLAVQRTYLDLGTDKGHKGKKALGPIKGLPIVVHVNPESLTLVLGEGIEKTHALAAGMDVDGWALPGKGFFRHILPIIPSYVDCITIIQDPDAEKEVGELASQLVERNIEVRIA